MTSRRDSAAAMAACVGAPVLHRGVAELQIELLGFFQPVHGLLKRELGHDPAQAVEEGVLLQYPVGHRAARTATNHSAFGVGGAGADAGPGQGSGIECAKMP